MRLRGFSASMAIADFAEKEGFWQARIPRSGSSNSTQNIIGLGTVSSIIVATVVINDLDVRSLGIFVGDTVYVNDVAIGDIILINSNNTITLSTVVGLNVDDFVYIMRNGAIEGDILRGYYCDIQLENTSTSFTELYAVNTWVKESKLHS